MKRSPRPYLARASRLLLLLVCVLRGRDLADAWQSIRDRPVPELLEEGIHEVRRVVDGDTLLIDVWRPRAPARHRHAGNSARRFRRRSVGAGSQPIHQGFYPTADNRVRLTFSLERKDRHDRFLAFVWDGDVRCSTKSSCAPAWRMPGSIIATAA